MRPLICIVGLVLLLNAVAPAAQTNAPAGQVPGVAISFVGFTNLGMAHTVSGFLTPATNQTILGPRSTILPGPTNFTARLPGGIAAAFQYTNSSPYPTLCAVQAMEYRTEAGWKTVPVPASRRQVLVRANATLIQTLPILTTNVAWRITVFCVEQATGVNRAVERAQEFGKQLTTGQKTEHFSGRKYLTISSQPVK